MNIEKFMLEAAKSILKQALGIMGVPSLFDQVSDTRIYPSAVVPNIEYWITFGQTGNLRTVRIIVHFTSPRGWNARPFRVTGRLGYGAQFYDYDLEKQSGGMEPRHREFPYKEEIETPVLLSAS